MRIELPYDAAVPLLGIHQENLTTLIREDMCTPMFTAASRTVAQTRKPAQCPSVEDRIRKTGCIYTMEHHSDIRKDEMLPFVTTWMDPQNIILSEISQTEEVKNHMNLAM